MSKNVCKIPQAPHKQGTRTAGHSACGHGPDAVRAVSGAFSGEHSFAVTTESASAPPKARKGEILKLKLGTLLPESTE